MAADSTVQVPGFYVNGKWERPEGCTFGMVTNPATGATIAEAPYAGEADIDRAVRAAHGAFLKWREVPVVERVQVLYRYKALLEKHHAELAGILTRENGKTADDARAEVRRAIQMVEVACGMPSLMMGDSLERRGAGHRLQDHPPAASASAPASRRSISRPWCRCGCVRSPSPAATRSY